MLNSHFCCLFQIKKTQEICYTHQFANNNDNNDRIYIIKQKWLSVTRYHPQIRFHSYFFFINYSCALALHNFPMYSVRGSNVVFNPNEIYMKMCHLRCLCLVLL